MIAKIKQYPILSLIILAVVLYLPSFFVFFSNDDWYHLRISQIDSIGQFINFFSFTPNDQTTPLYRPLSTQVVFFVMQTFFGLEVFFYRLLMMVVFCSTLYLIYKLVYLLSNNKNIALISAFVYLFSSTHFSRLFYFSTIQELLMTFFVLLSLLFYVQKYWYLSFCFFVLGLLSKETAVVLPILIILLELFLAKFNFKLLMKNIGQNILRLFPFFILLFFFLIFRLFYFTGADEGSYMFDFSIKKMINTGMWYGLWSIGVPEFLVDYVGSGLRVVPKFFTDFPQNSFFILGSCLLTIIFLVLTFLSSVKKNMLLVVLGAGIWVISLAPVLFLPWHKFTIELTLPLVGFSIIIASLLVSSRYKVIGYLFLVFYIVLNLYTYSLYFERHYTVTRAVIAERVFDYLKHNYPIYPENYYFEFINDTEDYGKEFGSSQQISHAISRSEMIRVLYKNRDLEVFYEDYKEASRPSNLQPIKLSTKEFLYQ